MSLHKDILSHSKFMQTYARALKHLHWAATHIVGVALRLEGAGGEANTSPIIFPLAFHEGACIHFIILIICTLLHGGTA